MLFLQKDTCTDKTGTSNKEEAIQETQVPDLRPSKIDQVAVEVSAFGNQVQDEARYPKGILRGRKQRNDQREKRNFSENHPGISLVMRATISQLGIGQRKFP